MKKRFFSCIGGGGNRLASHINEFSLVRAFNNLAPWGEKKFVSELKRAYKFKRGVNNKLDCHANQTRILSKEYSFFAGDYVRSTARNDVKCHTEDNSPKYRMVGEIYQCLINVDKRLRNKCAIVCDLFPRPFGERVRERGYLAASLLSRLAAFTLAEVLITLGIIGVVAAMTLPTLINNAQNKQLEVAFKKSYSALSQIAQRVALEDYGGQIPDNALGESLGYYAKYLNGKRCTGTAENGCPANADGDNYCNFMYKTYKDFSGKVGAPCIGNDYVVNVVSGSTFYFDFAAEGEGIYGKQFVVIDVNGWQKRPNKLGHDMFLFSIGRDGKITAGGADTSFYPKSGYCNSSTTFSRNGYGCTINAINEKDYFKKLPR